MQEINKFEFFLDVFLKWRRFLILIMFFVTIVSVIGLLLLPNWYSGEITFIPEDSGGRGFSFGLSGLNIDMSNIFTPDFSEQEIGIILESRKVLDAYAENFNIRERYKLKNRKSLYKFLEKNITIEKDEISGLGVNDILQYKITVFDKDKDLIVEEANFIIEEINRIIKEISTSKSQQLINIMTKLKEEQTLQIDTLSTKISEMVKTKGFIPPNLAMGSTEQSTLFTELQKQIAVLEMQKEINSRFYPKNSPIIKNIDNNILVLKEKLTNIKGSNDYENINFSKLSIYTMEYLKIYNELDYRKEILVELSKQLEIEKNKLNNLVSPIRILDKPYTPDKKSKPKRSILLILIFMSTFFVNVFLIVSYEIILLQPEELQKKIRNCLLKV